MVDICLEVSTATGLKTAFSGGQPRQRIYKIQRLGDQHHLRHHPDYGDGVGLPSYESYKSIDEVVHQRNIYGLVEVRLHCCQLDTGKHTAWPLQMESIGFSETLVNKSLFALGNIPKERKSQINVSCPSASWATY